ncbi:Carbamoyl-phosphate synthase small chain [Aureliella helgolandensis]|uniref:Carbamoyl phosphate synthase small chain n=1 Tax=Aureliella helgolandensis TaxID=2527968 RepID=A0A518G3Z2_9BACT|nr:Carbamoyl-phosphate synthase small chain [Aureliella helgolandensis]
MFFGEESELTRSDAAALLAFEDGTVFRGRSIGADGEKAGEVVFNTSMTGYQEILTDPSYCGQIVSMTYTEIGNYGTNNDDVESDQPRVAGFVVRSESRVHSNYRSQEGLTDYLKRHNIVAIAGVDTRALVRHIRSHGALKGILSTSDLDEASLVRKAKESQGLVGRDLVREVIPARARAWNQALHQLGQQDPARTEDPSAPHIVCLDYGMKWNIARHLYDRGNRVTILPGSATASEVMALNPDGIFLSNGPGDPEPLEYAINTIRELTGQRPIFGICLGHQLLSMAAGAKTFKLKFGHRGSNQPVLNLLNERVEITSQNHGFAVEESSLPDCLEITHRNLNDNTIAGVRHKSAPAFSVQYHPEASAGPHDSEYLFGEFQQLVAQNSTASK